MKTFRWIALVSTVVLLALVIAPSTAASEEKPKSAHLFSAVLTGYEEVPAISTPTAFGTFTLTVSEDDSSVDFELTYDGLPTTVSAAHIHLGQKGVNGGVSVFFCGGPRPACPSPGGTVTGTFTAEHVIGPAGQGIATGELDELLAAIRAGVTYANVHTMQYPGGEIRGLVVPAAKE